MPITYCSSCFLFYFPGRTEGKDNSLFSVKAAHRRIKKRKYNFPHILGNWEEIGCNSLWLTASSYMVKYLHISSYIRKSFLIYDFATDPIWIFLYVRKNISLSFFISVSYGLYCRLCAEPGLRPLRVLRLLQEPHHFSY